MIYSLSGYMIPPDYELDGRTNVPAYPWPSHHTTRQPREPNPTYKLNDHRDGNKKEETKKYSTNIGKCKINI
jgi:hypothetical protein